MSEEEDQNATKRVRLETEPAIDSELKELVFNSDYSEGEFNSSGGSTIGSSTSSTDSATDLEQEDELSEPAKVHIESTNNSEVGNCDEMDAVEASDSDSDSEYTPENDEPKQLNKLAFLPAILIEKYLEMLKIGINPEHDRDIDDTKHPNVIVGYTDYYFHINDCYNTLPNFRDCETDNLPFGTPVASNLDMQLMDNAGHQTFLDYTHPENPHRITKVAHFIKNHTRLFDFIENSIHNHPDKQSRQQPTYLNLEEEDKNLLDFIINPHLYNSTFSKQLDRGSITYRNNQLELIDEYSIHNNRGEYTKRHLADFISTLKFVHRKKYLKFLKNIIKHDFMENTDINMNMPGEGDGSVNKKVDIVVAQEDNQSPTTSPISTIKEMAQKYTDGSVYISGLSTVNRSVFGAYASIIMADKIMDPTTTHKHGFLINRPPGHHATDGKAAGFCLLNNAAMTTTFLLRRDFKEKLFNYINQVLREPSHEQYMMKKYPFIDDIALFYTIFNYDSVFNTAYQVENKCEVNIFNLQLELSMAAANNNNLSQMDNGDGSHCIETDYVCGINLKPFVLNYIKPKLAVLDFDIHYGNGTAGIFYEYENVTTISIHRYDDGHFYPGRGIEKYIEKMQGEVQPNPYSKPWEYDGGYWNIGNNLGQGHNINIPLPYLESPFHNFAINKTLNDPDAVTDPRDYQRGGFYSDADYLQIFRTFVLPILSDINPEAIVVASGFDAAAGDMLGNCLVTPFFYYTITETLCNYFKCPIMYCLEGGYNYDGLATGVYACIKAMVDCSKNTSNPSNSNTHISNYDTEDCSNDSKGIINPYLTPTFDIVSLLYLQKIKDEGLDQPPIVDEIDTVVYSEFPDADDDGDTIDVVNISSKIIHEPILGSTRIVNIEDAMEPISLELAQAISENSESETSHAERNVGDEHSINGLDSDEDDDGIWESTNNNYYFHEKVVNELLKKLLEQFSPYYPTLNGLSLEGDFLNVSQYISKK